MGQGRGGFSEELRTKRELKTGKQLAVGGGLGEHSRQRALKEEEEQGTRLRHRN